jgi:3-hydroxybutyryl-CoA dehydrogenase
MIKKVGVIGSGTMGSGIAQVAATSGCSVKLYDNSIDAIKKAEQNLDRILDRLIKKGRIDEDDKIRIQNNINYVSSLKDLNDSDMVIEAIVEDLNIKQKVFIELENLVSDECVIATNTSSLSVASISSALKRPDRCIGIHFFNPAPLMKLVEVIPAIQTSKDTLDNSVTILENWGKTVAVAKDTPGFIVNRIARPFYGEALRILDEGIADIATIDKAMKSIGGFRMGPFELMDFIGNDVNYTITETVFKAFYFDPRYKPSFTQKRMAEAGYLGRKTGKGYYQYDENGNVTQSNYEESISNDKLEYIFDRILVMLINEAADALYMKIASANDIDNAMTKGVNYPKGLLRWADEKGMEWCVEKMDKLYHTYHEDRYRCSPLLRKMKKEEKLFFS